MSGDTGATLVLSIDLELDRDHHQRNQVRRLDEIRSQLVALTAATGISATWAVADPMLSAATESILAAGCGHEIAVLGDQAWIGPGCGRVRLARELARRFLVPRKAGIPVSTLALRNVEQVFDLDLLIDSGVTAISPAAVENAAAGQPAAQPPIRFGLWQPPAAWKLPPRATWWAPTTWQIRREIKRAVRRRSLIHLCIDARRLVDAPTGSLDLVGSVLQSIADKRDAGQLHVSTINRLAARALGSRSAIPSRSILRPAA